jgi:hypothetical protein
MNRLLTTLFAASATIAVLIGTATAANPQAYQTFTSAKPPRSGSAFTGAALTVFVEGRQANGFRSIAFTCTRGSVKLEGRSLRLPVRVVRLSRDPDLGGQVESVSICTWAIPRGLAGKRLTAGYTIRVVNSDGTTAEDGASLAWAIR